MVASTAVKKTDESGTIYITIDVGNVYIGANTFHETPSNISLTVDTERSMENYSKYLYGTTACAQTFDISVLFSGICSFSAYGNLRVHAGNAYYTSGLSYPNSGSCGQTISGVPQTTSYSVTGTCSSGSGTAKITYVYSFK